MGMTRRSGVAVRLTLSGVKHIPSAPLRLIFTGGYPRLEQRPEAPPDFCRRNFLPDDFKYTQSL